jgi:hypothetical protein
MMKAVVDAIVVFLALGGDGADVTKRRSSTSGKKPLDPTLLSPQPSPSSQKSVVTASSHELPKYDEETTYALHWDELLLAEHRERVADFLERRKNWSRKR